MKDLKNISLLLLLMFFVAIGCSESPLPEPEDPNPTEVNAEAPELTQKINSFIKLVMNDIYLWYKDIPDIDIRYEADSKAYFKKILYKDDKWSFITDDVKGLEASFEGVETSYGYSLAFGTFSNTGNVFALVEFVYPNTPASQAGIKRGDILVKMNGADITKDNYTDLLYASSLSVNLGILGENGITVDPKSVSMNAKVLNLDPVLITDIVEHGGKRIGYLFYAQYISNYNSSLDEAFQYFMNEGITDLVVDLRYNPGGGIDAAQYFCSSIAPLTTVNNKETLVTLQWNDKLQQLMEKNNYTHNLLVSFTDTTAVKMGLNKVYFLTGQGTASASELTITGLKPYMNVTTVGETTYGKYTASNTFKPEDFYTSKTAYQDFENWALQPIIAKYANSLGVTDFKDGFKPDISIEDDLFSGLQLGDKNEPLLKAAIEDITGTPIVAMKKARIVAPDHDVFDRGFSKYDANKRELLIDGIMPELSIE